MVTVGCDAEFGDFLIMLATAHEVLRSAIKIINKNSEGYKFLSDV